MLAPLLRVLVPGLVIVGAIVLLSASSSQLSLATDVGKTDDATCRDIAGQHGADAVARLEQSGFPHATGGTQEVYRLSRDGTPEALVGIDWAQGVASCVPLDYAGPIAANLDMTPKAYGALVGELRSVIVLGHLTAPSVANGWALYWGSHVHADGRDWTGDMAYKGALAKWAAGYLIQHPGGA